MHYVFQSLSFLLIITVLIACQNDAINIEENQPDPIENLNLPLTPFEYEEVQFPSHFLTNDYPNNFQFQFAAIESDNTPANNPITNEGVLLGRVLFYEKKLSANGTISCASCHNQDIGFADPRKFSEGFEGGLTRRHSMGLTNARFYDTGKFFWDERAETLEEQVLMPFQDPVEMGMTLHQVVQTVKDQPYASTLFEGAFGDETVNTNRISKAIAQFIRSLVSFNSKYDEGRSLVNSPLTDFPNFKTFFNREVISLLKRLYYK